MLRIYDFHSATRSGSHLFQAWLSYQITDGFYTTFGNQTDQNIRPFYKGEYVPSMPETDSLLYFRHTEDTDLSRLTSIFFNKGSDRTILLLRDPFNMVASRLANKRKGNSGRWADPIHGRDIWVHHASEVARETKYVPDDKFSPVIFNYFISNQDYRKSIADSLGGSYTDYDFTTTAMTGSSFIDKRPGAYSIAPSDVLERYKQFADDEEYIAAVGNKSPLFNMTVRLTEKLFPELIPGLEEAGII